MQELLNVLEALITIPTSTQQRGLCGDFPLLVQQFKKSIFQSTGCRFDLYLGNKDATCCRTASPCAPASEPMEHNDEPTCCKPKTTTESSLTTGKTPCAAEETQPNDKLMNRLKKGRCLCNCVYCMFLSSAYRRDFIARRYTIELFSCLKCPFHSLMEVTYIILLMWLITWPEKLCIKFLNSKIIFFKYSQLNFD